MKMAHYIWGCLNKDFRAIDALKVTLSEHMIFIQIDEES